MKKPFYRQMMPILIVLIGLMVTVDVLIDQLGGHSWISSLVHVVFGGVVLLAAHRLVDRALESRREAETILERTHAELEGMVQERTAELKLANESLRQEISERVKADIERERLIVQIGAARQRAEDLVAELHLANNMLVTLIDTLPAGMVIVDAEGRVVLANSRARSYMKDSLAGDIYEIRDDLSLRRTDDSAIDWDDLPLVRAIRKGEHTSGLEVTTSLETGEHVHLLIAASPVLSQDGVVVNAVEIMQDITHLKEMERALRESEEKYRTQFDAFSEPTTVWDRSGRLLMQNLISAQNMNGRREDFVGKTVLEIFGEPGNAYLERLQRVIDTGISEYQEDVVDLPKGRRYFWTCIQSIRGSDGQVAAQILSYDVTDRRQIEESVRVSEEKFSTVFHFSPNPVGIIRVSDGEFLEINHAFSDVTGWPRSELLGRKWTEIGFDPAQSDQEALQRQFRETGSVQDYELPISGKQGEGIVLLISLIPITIREDPCVLAIAHDITERKRSEEMLRRTQEELALGIQERSALQERQRLARELHDSVSQALYGISLGAHTALTFFNADQTKVLDAINYVLTLAQAGLTEMRALIFELRPESLMMEGLVTAIGKQTAALRARHGIEVDYRACEEPDISYKVKEAVYRIAQEAMQNAMKHAHPSRLEVVLCCDSEGLSMDISDDGIGFDPLAAYPGHLGLHSMHERAESIDGVCEITSEPQHGTQVHVRVPSRAFASLN